MSPRRILIIEDADHLRDLLRLTLEFKGYAVTAAADGAAGLRAAKAERFDLIFCDIEMPVMNGLEFVRAYRAEVDGATPIVMLTAEAAEVVHQALAAGANKAISKPFEPIQIMREIEARLGTGDPANARES